MEKAEIKSIADYLKDLEEGLYEWDYRGLTTQGHLTKLYGIIERLMQATFETKDQQLKVLLASLEYKARKCKECIERNYPCWHRKLPLFAKALLRRFAQLLLGKVDVLLIKRDFRLRRVKPR